MRAALRSHGVPSRLRVGFATYFVAGLHEDHALCEYWADGAWRLMDPELDDEALGEYGIDFDPWNVPRDQFLTAGEAWRAIRAGRINPATCGVSFIGIGGLWFAAASVVRDLAALNKREMLQWDYWGLARDLSPGTPDVSPALAARLDAAAAITGEPEPSFTAVRALYDSDDALRIPRTVKSFGPTGPRDVVVPPNPAEPSRRRA